MNYMKQIATDILGLYWDDEKNESEAFKIKEFDFEYKITPGGLRFVGGGYMGHERIVELLKGELEIERIPWKPKKDEKYYCIRKNGDIDWNLNYVGTYDAAIIKSGWVFRSKEEAEANKERVLKEMREALDE